MAQRWSLRLPPTTRAWSPGGLQNLAGCLLARMDGKSRVDYLPGESQRNAVRTLARKILADEPRTWDDVEEML